MLPSVRERGEFVATFRWIHVRLMETIAAWVPTTPEMEVKLLFGAHIWDVAQHADALGKRTFELRMPLQHSLEPTEPYRAFLADLSRTRDTAERFAFLYEGMFAALARRYRKYLEQTDRLLDAPTVRILEHIAREQQRMIKERDELLVTLPALVLRDRESLARMLAREAAIEKFVVHRSDASTAAAG
jgi:hypothetical protein